MEGAPSTSSPAASSPSFSEPPSSIGGGSGFTVDFGFDNVPAPTPAPIPVPASSTGSEEPFNFDLDAGSSNPAAVGTVALEPELPAQGLAPEPIPAPPLAQPVASARLTLKRGGMSTNESFTFGPGAVVGRFDPESGPVDVDLAPLPEASYVSRHHAEFRFDAGNNQWFVRDMGSRNGTFQRAGGQGVFSRLSAETPIESGDEISLGNARFEFQTL